MSTVLIYTCRRRCTSLELELRRQIDTAVGRAARGIRESHDVVGDAEETRTQHAAGIGNVHVVEGVAEADAEGGIVAPIGIGIAHLRSAAKERAATPTTAATATRSTGTPLANARTFRDGAKADRLGEAKIHDEMIGTGFRIDRFPCSGRTGRVKGSVRRAVNVRAARVLNRRTGRTGNETGGSVQLLVAVEIVGRGDAERRAGADDHERAQAEKIGQADAAAEKEAMPNVEGAASIILADVVRVRGEGRNAAGIALRVVQSVVAEELHLTAHPNIGVHDELLLLEVRFRNVTIEVSARGGRAGRKRGQRKIRGRTGRARKGRIGIDSNELIEAPRIQISNGECRRLADLALQADRVLPRARRMQMRSDLING